MRKIGSLLQTTELSAAFGGLVAVNCVSVQIGEGELLSLIGPNGAGKTTFLNLLTGFTRPTRGSVRYRGGEIAGLSPNLIASRGILRTFQHNSLLFNLTVFENVLTGFHSRARTGLWGSMLSTRRFREEERTLREEALNILKTLGMDSRKGVIAKNLPFGDQRKLGIGIALAARPAMLLLDEPAAGMNPDEGLRLMELLRQLKASGITILLVEHDMRVVMGISDRIIVLNRGEKIAEGTPNEISANAQVIQVYLGDREPSPAGT